MILNKTAKNLLNNSYISRFPVSYRCKKLIAFSLAEVLVTLLIIGVIASLVVPALINETKEAEFHTAWKKAYSDIEQVTRRIVMDNSGGILSQCNIFPNKNECLRDYFLNYFNYTKKCDYACYGSNCWHYSNSWKMLNDSPAGAACGASAILTNGNLLHFHLSNSGNGGWILVDINGFKKPNTIGKDIFGISLLPNSIKPYGIENDLYQNTCSSTGWGCAAIYLYR